MQTINKAATHKSDISQNIINEEEDDNDFNNIQMDIAKETFENIQS